jgi:hypothetical protein
MKSQTPICPTVFDHALMPVTFRRRQRETVMGKNVGTIDRTLRIVVGLVLIALVFVGPQTPWGWIGIVPLATALIGWCPAYRLIGMNTCAIGKRS